MYAFRGDDESVAMPATPLLNGGMANNRRKVTKSKMICALSILFVLVFIIAIILIALRANGPEINQGIPQNLQNSAISNENTKPPCPTLGTKFIIFN